ncbi:hypothetical protein [Sphingomonas sp. ACRSK]|uniref:hypothetical protein n=1 Tax=Sphingomonas sp. ACRSK TaxID=2918213 RepID=UPI001EF4BC16|nr:hypothetical protein [Sphingomonas sp. ACRSK]MCG7348838.1 hypothetical protein [Sphingomonas sp. ACRSK]
MVLDLEPCTLAEAKRKISWQHQPGGHTDFEWRICILVNGVFMDDEGMPQMVHRSPYTQETWDRFCRTYGAGS